MHTITISAVQNPSEPSLKATSLPTFLLGLREKVGRDFASLWKKSPKDLKVNEACMHLFRKMSREQQFWEPAMVWYPDGKVQE